MMSEKQFTDVAETPREELECKKKYLYEYSMFWECNDGSKCQILEDDVVRLLNEQQATIEEQNKLIEKLRWDLNKTREDLNYFANLKVMAMKGCEPNE